MLDFGKLAITLGYRSEDYEQRHRRWSDKAGPNLTEVRIGPADNRDTMAYNDHTTSSIAATYDLNDTTTLIAGFHEGMTPMFGADPEEADNGVSYPISVNYTSTDATFKNSSESDYFGLVAAGDDLPYIPDIQSSIIAGFITDNGLSGSARLVNVGSSCSIAACGIYNKIDSYSSLDLSIRKAINSSMDVYVILENTLDDEDLISRAPSEGARSQKPRTMKVGFSYDF